MPDNIDATPAPPPADAPPERLRYSARGSDGRFLPSGAPRRRGAQLGNLNSPGARIAPWRTLLRRGRVRREFSWVVKLVEAKADDYLAHLGGEAKVTEAERTLVSRAALLHGAVLLVVEAMAKAQDPLSVLDDLAKVVRLERDLLATLGMERRTEETPDLGAYLRRKAAAPATALQEPARPAILAKTAEGPPSQEIVAGRSEGEAARGVLDAGVRP